MYTARRSGLNGKSSKQANLLLIVDGENRHNTAIKNISRLLSKLNGKNNCTHHVCIKCLNGFRTASEREKQYEYCSSNGHLKAKMPFEKEK